MTYEEHKAIILNTLDFMPENTAKRVLMMHLIPTFKFLETKIERLTEDNQALDDWNMELQSTIANLSK